MATGRLYSLGAVHDYAALPGGPMAMAARIRLRRTIEFVPVPDMAARVAGLQAGDYLMP